MEFNEEWLMKTIKDKVANHELNNMDLQPGNERYFQEPLVGFVKGNDSFFPELKKIIGENHFTPYEMLKWKAEELNVDTPDINSIGVVSYILPANRKTINENAGQSDWLGERWAQTRLFGEKFNQALMKEMVDLLTDNGILSVAPDQTPLFKRERNDKVGFMSSWSHRHIAYAAGLGTFGIHDFLITEKGAAHRCGSFVVNMKLKPNYERNKDFRANCLHYQNIKCMKCAARCPVNAIKVSGHDKDKCFQRVEDSRKICSDTYKLDIYGCGLCSTDVPCESGIPEELKG